LPRNAEKILACCDQLLRLPQEPMACGGQHDARARPLEERDAELPARVDGYADSRAAGR
jgi:hypothetical protein